MERDYLVTATVFVLRSTSDANLRVDGRPCFAYCSPTRPAPRDAPAVGLRLTPTSPIATGAVNWTRPFEKGRGADRVDDARARPIAFVRGRAREKCVPAHKRPVSPESEHVVGFATTYAACVCKCMRVAGPALAYATLLSIRCPARLARRRARYDCRSVRILSSVCRRVRASRAASRRALRRPHSISESDLRDGFGIRPGCCGPQTEISQGAT